MASIKTIELRPEQRTELEGGYGNGESHAFRLRCQTILLKSEKRTSLEVSVLVGSCEVTVNKWLLRYEQEGISGLHTKPGRGRKAILNAETDLEQIKATVKATVRENRQRLRLAKADLEEELGKKFSQLTLRRFLKKTIAATNELDG